MKLYCTHKSFNQRVGEAKRLKPMKVHFKTSKAKASKCEIHHIGEEKIKKLEQKVRNHEVHKYHNLQANKRYGHVSQQQLIQTCWCVEIR